MIPGVIITPLKQIPDARGKVMHMLKRTDAHFGGFGEIYFSIVNPGAIKAWKKHLQMTLNLAVIHGAAKLVVHDDQTGKFQEIVLGPENNYSLVTVPPGLWTGFTSAGAQPAMVANCASLPHDPNEVVRKAADDPGIPYDWKQP